MKPKNLIKSCILSFSLVQERCDCCLDLNAKSSLYFIRFSFDLIDSRHPVSLFLLFFFLLQLAQRECIHKVAVHSASGLNYGSYFLWVAGWYPTFVYRSLRYGNAVVYTSTSLCTLLPLKLPRPPSTTSPNYYRVELRVDGITICDWQLYYCLDLSHLITCVSWHWAFIFLQHFHERT